MVALLEDPWGNPKGLSCWFEKRKGGEPGGPMSLGAEGAKKPLTVALQLYLGTLRRALAASKSFRGLSDPLYYEASSDRYGLGPRHLAVITKLGGSIRREPSADHTPPQLQCFLFLGSGENLTQLPLKFLAVTGNPTTISPDSNIQMFRFPLLALSMITSRTWSAPLQVQISTLI